MTTMSIPVVPRVASRRPVVRRLALAAGVALIAWAKMPSERATHEQQALRLRAETDRRRATEGFRFGIAQ
ncbi:hypothetical protein [Microcella sp.]|uniref:hypothetical protein n=1 Tax=Microcella sp. TaxID=1913979 RepID=UPI00391CE834